MLADVAGRGRLVCTRCTSIEAGAAATFTASSSSGATRCCARLESSAWGRALDPALATVPVAAFRLDVTPVTEAGFAAFVAAHPRWRRDRVPGIFADAGYLRHWASAEGPGAGARPDAPVVNVSWFAARAYCQARGARLPVEAEWEAAAVGALRRGFVWGEVLEWVAGSARAFPGHADPPGEIDPLPGSTAEPGAWGVLRGACALTPARAVHPRARRFARVDDDVLPTGFRSCAR